MALDKPPAAAFTEATTGADLPSGQTAEANPKTGNTGRTAALDFLRFQNAEEIAAMARGLAEDVGTAAAANNALALRFRTGLLSKTVRSLLIVVDQLGNPEAVT